MAELVLKDTMSRSRLIQRLNKPTGFTNPFAFGAGHPTGGLSDEAMKLLNSIFSFDYMGQPNSNGAPYPPRSRFSVMKRERAI